MENSSHQLFSKGEFRNVNVLGLELKSAPWTIDSSGARIYLGDNVMTVFVLPQTGERYALNGTIKCIDTLSLNNVYSNIYLFVADLPTELDFPESILCTQAYLVKRVGE